jgi:cation diffusion facilitator CzcD-associated flavoprotein CzcO
VVHDLKHGLVREIKNVLPVPVAGGGIVGLAAAIALTRQGFE